MPPPKPRGQAPLLEAKALGHRFADGVWAFRGIDFSLEAGRISVLAGRNGAGKTFFAKHLAGLLKPTEGTVLFSGAELAGPTLIPASKVGYVFQDARLQAVGDTVLDDALFGPTNLGLGRDEALVRSRKALADCGLGEMEGSFVHRLSGGEQRRLAIAGVLAMAPSALILDEPFANLDLHGVRSVLRIVQAIASEGLAVLVVTHEIEKLLALADRFSVMDGGRIVLSGPPLQVLKKGIEGFGLRDPFRSLRGLKDLSWLE
jgi:biotin transport system ATP-binding protein